ncbi:MAG: hypothetical protein V3T31_10780, partial [candidate division Zixibacteria bacterium]
MEKLQVALATHRYAILALVMIALMAGLATADVTDNPRQEAVAWVVDYNASVKINRSDSTLVFPGMDLFASDTLFLSDTGYISLLSTDGSVRKLRGPIAVPAGADNAESSGIVARLMTSLSGAFFSRDEQTKEARLGTRSVFLEDQEPARLPKIISPPSGARMAGLPNELRWQAIEGVTTYTVVLADRSSVIGQYNTMRPLLDLSFLSDSLGAGEYLFEIEAFVGSSSLRSEQAQFAILTASQLAEINKRISSISDSIDDDRLEKLLAAELYFYQDMFAECHELVDELLEVDNSDFVVLHLKARLLERIGAHRAANDVYRQLIS